MLSLLLSLSAVGCGPLRDDAPPPVAREFRAVWVATVDNVDWPEKGVFDPAKQRAELIRLLDKAADLKMNAVIFQVRTAADALYSSRYEPWSVYLTGRQGRAPQPPYDPLAFAIEEAHKRGLELHAWFNPYRAQLLSASSGPLASRHIARTNRSVVKKYGSFLWMDPGEPLVQQRSLEVIDDVVRRYDVDGVHIDDYFYPYPEGGKDFPDDDSYARYGHGLSKTAWRHKNVDDFVETAYESVHKIKPWVQFGISPFGIYRPGYPAGIKAGIDQYAELYADPLKWLRNGWCDYMAPQLYWPIAQKAQSFPALLDWWREQNVQNRHVWPGIYTSRLLSSKTTLGPQEFVNEILLCRQGTEDAGHIHFSMKALEGDSKGIDGALMAKAYTEPALPPASPWLNPETPPAPRVKLGREGHIAWEPRPGETPFWFVVWTRYGSEWLTRVLPGDASELNVKEYLPAGKLNRVCVAAVSRTGVESDPGAAR
ncbi:MAG TPA: family 10 glycosylhydrolase [Fimbriimonas sp.]|nr:family 10 glycosylhydrolase [Fimbriimonas sp.]